MIHGEGSQFGRPNKVVEAITQEPKSKPIGYSTELDSALGNVREMLRLEQGKRSSKKDQYIIRTLKVIRAEFQSLKRYVDSL
jgi:hypothetical protein